MKGFAGGGRGSPGAGKVRNDLTVNSFASVSRSRVVICPATDVSSSGGGIKEGLFMLIKASDNCR